MTSTELLRRGTEAARAGQRSQAREIFLRVVETEPRNEMAWMWLTGLVDELEDKIIACENVLTINPANEKVKTYLETLLQRKAAIENQVAYEKRVAVQRPEVAARPQTASKPGNAPDFLSQAEQLEYSGKIEEAIKAYEQLAAKTKDSQTFDHVYRQIVRLQGLQREKIRHVSPVTSILRMTFT